MVNVRSELANWFGDYYDQLQVLFTSNLPANSSIMVQQKLVYALIVSGSIDLWDQQKITYRPVYPEVTASSVLAWKRGQPFSLAVEKFIFHMKQHRKQES